MPTDLVALTVPAMPPFASIIRLTAASLAARDDFDYDRVEDVRVAVGEAVAVLLGPPATGADRAPDTGSVAAIESAGPLDGVEGSSGTLDATFHVAEDELILDLVLRDGPTPPPVEALSRQILQATTDHFSIDRERRGAATVSVRLGRHGVER